MKTLHQLARKLSKNSQQKHIKTGINVELDVFNNTVRITVVGGKKKSVG